MAKVSPVSIKYMIHAKLTAEGTLEKPDVIGALFGQTEGLLGNELEMRELQKEGKIGRIEVQMEKIDKMSVGTILIPSALDQSETTLIAAAIETIDRVGPCDAQIEVEKIEDVRGSKRDYILDRAKKLLQGMQTTTDSREMSNGIKDSVRVASVSEYGEEKLPCGDISGNELIVVEGRADVVNLVRNNVKNVIGMNGTKLPEGVRTLSKEKEVTLFVDGDRGGKLIAKNVVDNAKVAWIAVAPDGKEVEELAGKEILIALRRRVSVAEFFNERTPSRFEAREEKAEPEVEKVVEEDTPITEETIAKIKTIFKKNEGSEKAVLLNSKLEEIRTVFVKTLGMTIERTRERIFAIVIDGAVTKNIMFAAEDAGCKLIAAKNFATSSDKIKLVSF